MRGLFCPECGKKNEAGAKFCEFCGAKMEDNTQTVTPKEVKPHRPMKKSTKILIIIIVAIVVILVAAYLILSNNYKPSKVAEDYFVALADKDTDKLYNYLDIKENEFTTKKIFSEVFDEEEDTELLNYKVESETISSDGLSATVTINYTLKDDKEPSSAVIYLVKDKNNNLLIFDNWKISNQESLVVEDYVIRTIKGSSLKLEGVDVDKKYLDENSNSDYDVYTIPSLFRGDYDATVTLENGLSFESTLSVDSYGSANLTNLELDDENEEAFETEISKVVSNLYSSAMEQKNFSDIKSTYEYEGADLTDLEDAYDSFKNSIGSGNLTRLEVSGIDIQRDSITDEGYIFVTVEIDYDYTVKSSYNDETYDNTDSDIAYLTFDYYDNSYKLIDMSSMQTYFSRY